MGNYAGEEMKSFEEERKWIEGFSDGFPVLAPVGSFAENEHGLYDLGGNVWEYCQDAFSDDSQIRVARGGELGVAYKKEIHSFSQIAYQIAVADWG